MAEIKDSAVDRGDSLARTKSQQRETWLRGARLGILSVFALFSLTLVAGCGASASSAGASNGAAPAAKTTPQTQKVFVDGGSYTNVSASGLASMLKSKDFPLINVHVPYEGEIQGTDLFVPYTDIQSNLSRLPADKSAKIFLYCRSGNMSDIAARALVKLGYSNVWNLDGGMIAWKQAGYEVVEKAH